MLNTPESQRSKNTDEQLGQFAYINGKLFEETLPMADFSTAMREALLDACALDWSAISPAIFGSLFQSIMDDKARRNLGAHYTSEANILKLIKPLFLDELHAEFERIKGNRNKLFEFQKKAAATDVPRPGLRLRQLPCHQLPRTARAGTEGAACQP